MNEEIDQDRAPQAARKVILVTDRDAGSWLEPLVEQWLHDRIAWVATVGPDCVRIEAQIDELAVGGGLDRSRFMMTTSHPHQTLDDVTDFMLALVSDYEGDVAIVEA